MPSARIALRARGTGCGTLINGRWYIDGCQFVACVQGLWVIICLHVSSQGGVCRYSCMSDRFPRSEVYKYDSLKSAINGFLEDYHDWLGEAIKIKGQRSVYDGRIACIMETARGLFPKHIPRAKPQIDLEPRAKLQARPAWVELIPPRIESWNSSEYPLIDL